MSSALFGHTFTLCLLHVVAELIVVSQHIRSRRTLAYFVRWKSAPPRWMPRTGWSESSHAPWCSTPRGTCRKIATFFVPLPVAAGRSLLILHGRTQRGRRKLLVASITFALPCTDVDERARVLAQSLSGMLLL